MGLKIDNSPIDMRLFKMEATIENIVFLVIIANLAVNQLMECEADVVVTLRLRLRRSPNGPQ